LVTVLRIIKNGYMQDRPVNNISLIISPQLHWVAYSGYSADVLAT